MDLPVEPTAPSVAPPDACPTGEVAVTRTAAGWAVVSPAGTETAGDLVEGLTLADLVSEELGRAVEPDRTARRSARGPAGAGADIEDPQEARIAALERTVAQLEHALAARVSIERAIGVLAERHGVPPRTAFDGLRGSARSQGRPVAELAHEVLVSLPTETAAGRQDCAAAAARVAAAPPPRPAVVAGVPHRDPEDSVAGGRR